MMNKLRDQLVRLPNAPKHTCRWPDSKEGKRKHVYMKNKGSHDCGSFHLQDHLASANYVSNPGQNTCFPLPVDGRTWPRAQSQRRKPFAFENDRKCPLQGSSPPQKQEGLVWAMHETGHRDHTRSLPLVGSTCPRPLTSTAQPGGMWQRDSTSN